MAEAGSVTEGAARIHRSQSAVSLQIKRLERILGRRVLTRHGRGVAVSEAGERLLPVAREVVARLDGALAEIGGDRIRGKLRLGIPDDHGRERLSRIVGAFSASHPAVELEVTCALSPGFPRALARGELDLAVYEVETPGSDEEVLFEDPTCWVAAHDRLCPDDAVLPVALFDRACRWRDAALAALQARGRPCRVVYSSQSVAGVLAAVEAGVAVGLIGRSALTGKLRVLGHGHGFGPTPSSKLVLRARAGADTAAVSAMQSAIRAALN